MLTDYPILEFDPAPNAMIEPQRPHTALEAPEHAVACFFWEVIDDVSPRAKVIARFNWEDAEHAVYEIEFEGRRLAVFHPGVGGPLAAGLLEEVITLGCRKIIACGGAGALDPSIVAGHVVVPTAAVRDEGTSYHYLPPGREVRPSPEAVTAIESALREADVEYVTGRTWTTDAPYRETAEKIRRRREEGCLTVEMEAASFFAVAQFRDIVFGQLLYGGDDLSGEEWDQREWRTHEVRERLFRLAAKACLRL